MLTPVYLPAGVAGVALFFIFIAILNLYLIPLLPSSAVLLPLSLLFFQPGSSQGNKVVKVEDADIVWPVCVCVFVHSTWSIWEPRGLYPGEDLGMLPAKWHWWRHLCAHVYSMDCGTYCFFAFVLLFYSKNTSGWLQASSNEDFKVFTTFYVTFKVAWDQI